MGLFGKKYTIETLQKAILADDIDEARTCIEKGVDLNGPYRLPPLYIAVAQGSLGLVQLFIEKGAKVDPDMGPNSDATVLTTACESGNEAIVDYLLSKGADANGKTGTGFSALWKAAANGRDSICEKLLKKGADAKDCAATVKAFTDAGLGTRDSRNVEKYLASIGMLPAH
jgi:ankyrin repeat protein